MTSQHQVWFQCTIVQQYLVTLCNQQQRMYVFLLRLHAQSGGQIIGKLNHLIDRTTVVCSLDSGAAAPLSLLKHTHMQTHLHSSLFPPIISYLISTCQLNSERVAKKKGRGRKETARSTELIRQLCNFN